MSVFESLNNTTDKATGIGERYIKASHQYLRLKIFQQLTSSVSLMAKVLIIGGFLFVGFIFCSIALAIEIGRSLNSLALGCLIVGLMFMVIGFILFKTRKKINSIIIKKIGLNFFK
ncbi:hypothetical protein [Winogradskyella sp. SYSU M77433]|uniref:hypothetical protein n=1 Tax=Winogradskyella sp. SYSU M77433 TaxID=3042722 RepID=UPI00248148FE|nr:hypothetical protein [Winogradskyella sp. SYSU M77433]MDH7912895.1 hypothetical protein [Winogradskyella sp. SYSU M77433]